MKSCSLKMKLVIIIAVGWCALLVTAFLGLNGLRHTVRELESVYQENVINSQRVARMNDLLLNTRVQLLLSLQHDPGSDFVKLHDHPTSMHMEQVKNNIAEFARIEAEYKKGTLSEKERKLQDDFLQKGAILINDGFRPVEALINNGSYNEAAVLTLQKINPLFKPATEAAEAIYKNEQAEAKKSFEDGSADYRTAMVGVSLSLILSLIVMSVAGGLIIRSVAAMAGTLKDVANRLAGGDLTARAKLTCDDELGSIAKSFDAMADSFAGFITSVQHAVLNLSESAKQFTTSSERIAFGVEGVASQSVGVATASEEMAATSGDIAQNCTRAADSAQIANDRATTGSEVVQQTIAGMQRISERVQATARTVEALGQRSDQIGAIIGTIEDIADQTNLLALNAAIEAARAGEMGRGFAVVADEVRALAERTTRATREIGEMIKAIQHETKGAVAAMEEGVAEVERGTAGASRSGEVLLEILSQIQDVTMQVSQIATAAEEQTATTGEITSNIQRINDVAQHSSSEAHGSAKAAITLNELAEKLQIEVRKFKTAESELFILELAKGDHRKFIETVDDVIKGYKSMEASALSTHMTCRFGKWYSSEGLAMCGSLPAYRAIAGPHEKIHSLAREAVAAHNSGDKQKAERFFAEAETLSHQIIDLLGQMAKEARSSQ
jgi:methyl-accepting chemotaxis protein